MRFDDLLHAPRRHWGKGLILFLIVVVGTVAATALQTPRFKSYSKLYVGLGRENTTLDPTATFGNSTFVALPPSREDEINSVVQILLSRALAEKVVDAVGVDAILGEPAASDGLGFTRSLPDGVAAVWERITPFSSLPRREQAIRQFSQRLEVGAVKRSSVITLNYEAKSPAAAQTALGELIDAYMNLHMKLNRRAGSNEFLERQANDSRTRLERVEDELQKLKGETHVASLEEQRRILEVRMGTLQDRLFDTEAELKQSSAEVAALEVMLKSLPATLVSAKVEGHPNQAADLMRQQLYALELREKELLTKYKEEVFLVQDIRRQIAEAKAILADESGERTQTTTSLNQVHEQLRHTYLARQAGKAALEAKAEALARQLSETQEETSRLNERAVQIARLERASQLEESAYRKYAENLEQTRLDQALEAQRITNVVTAQPPTLEERITRPNKPLNYAIGLLLGIVGALALCVLLEQRREGQRLSLEEQLDREPDSTRPLATPRTSSSGRAADVAEELV
jgi:uncharacterized protein involved in exopolysaccharide biosynthesis